MTSQYTYSRVEKPARVVTANTVGPNDEENLKMLSQIYNGTVSLQVTSLGDYWS